MRLNIRTSPVTYMTKRKSALTDAKRDPKMGQYDSPWLIYGRSVNYTMGLTGTVWPVHMGACLHGLGHAGKRLFGGNIFGHLTKPMVRGHSPPMGHVFS